MKKAFIWMKEIVKEEGVNILIVLVILNVGFCFVNGGPNVSRGDAIEYIEMRSYLPALYPMLLAFFRLIFSDSYLWAVIVFQTFFSLFSIIFLRRTICATFDARKKIETIMMDVLLTSSLFEGGTSIADGLGSVNWGILTEGISYSLLYIWVAFLIRYLLGDRNREWISSLIFGLLLILCRDQFWVCVGIDILIILYKLIIKRVEIKKILGMLVTVLLFSALAFSCQRIYTNILREGNDDSFRRSHHLAQLCFFMNEEDIKTVSNPVIGSLLSDINSDLIEQGLTKECSSGKWIEEVTLNRKGFLSIMKVVRGWLEEYSENIEGLSVLELDKMAEQALYNHTGDWMVMSCIKQFPIIISMSVFVYFPNAPYVSIIFGGGLFVAFLILLAYDIYKNKGFSPIGLFAFLLLAFIIATGWGTTLAVRPIARYLTYSFGIFYIILYLMVKELWKRKINFLAD